MTATMHPYRRVERTRPAPIRPNRAVQPVQPVEPDHINYAARRAVAALVALVVLAIVAFAGAAMVGALGGSPAVAADSAPAVAGAPVVRIHVAQPGDTLWSIADQYRGDVGRGRFVDALIDANGGTAIQIGQAVRLP